MSLLLCAAKAREYNVEYDSSLPAHLRRPDLYEPINPSQAEMYDPNATTASKAGLKPIL